MPEGGSGVALVSVKNPVRATLSDYYCRKDVPRSRAHEACEIEAEVAPAHIDASFLHETFVHEEVIHYNTPDKMTLLNGTETTGLPSVKPVEDD